MTEQDAGLNPISEEPGDKEPIEPSDLDHVDVEEDFDPKDK